ncbi:MAG TPA: lycopene cyclase [Pseudomonas xinjiangensis]|uniref:Lycopene cyclase n=2 Tax=root TaxID=1 RepID=A0A7V1FSU0_9GAMM|nr:lycopene cyclase [Halopseudomonas xinjiangensis]HEC47304.1 lycopene cyclase [Halopseudomonas xinjiangensis]
MTFDYDLILVGGGLANGLIAWRLKTLKPHLRLLLLEQGDALGGNHTWSFHDGDLSPAEHRWVAPLVGKHWDHYRVIFPGRKRILHSGYASIFSRDFARVIGATLADQMRLGASVEMVTPTTVTLATGETLQARAVIDGRGARPSPHLALGYQAFLGQEVRLAAPHGLEAPILMDASVEQGEGYRFVYVLPFSADTLLIEDTHYVSLPTHDSSRLRDNIGAYAQAQGWQISAVLREEEGVLPITLAGDFSSFWDAASHQPISGLRAGLFHPTTGYSVPHAVRLADQISAMDSLDAEGLFTLIHTEAQREWRHQGFFRLLNRMLFLAGRPDRRWTVMQRFYGLPEGLIGRFYAGRLKPIDKIRILTGKPPVPLGQAFKAARLFDPNLIR